MADSPTAESWKFCPVNENSLSTLINKEIWFSKPKLFNDPFDCQMDIDSVFDDVEKMLAETKNESLNAFREGMKLDFSRDIYAYYCACKNWRHTLMWSHYAKNHEGIALGFSFDANSPIKITELNIKDIHYDSKAFWNQIARVNDSHNLYEANRPGTPGLMAGESNQFFASFTNAWIELYEIIRFMKAECWHYEEELRFETELEEGNKVDGVLRGFSAEDLKHVIFGLNCNDKNKKTILDLLSSKEWQHVKKWECYRNPIELSVDCCEYKT
jgi:hypothetical protein